jgi:P27 family predicted phage terminase small subunit
MAGSGAGAPRKPTKLKVLQGTEKPERRNDREPKPAGNDPLPPENMSAGARVIWDRIIRDYGATGILTGVDTETFRAYCDACVRYEQAAVLLDKAAPLIRSARGDFVKNPLHQIARDNAFTMLRLARELGFTPSARASLEVPEGGDELDAWARSG